MANTGSWVFRNGQLVPKDQVVAQRWAQAQRTRSDLPSPAIRRDDMTPFVSSLDGKTTFDSKSAWERHVKEHGAEIVGNDNPKPKDDYFGSAAHKASIRDDVKTAFDQIEQNAELPPIAQAKPGEFDLSSIPKDGGDHVVYGKPDTASEPATFNPVEAKRQMLDRRRAERGVRLESKRRKAKS